MSGRVVVTGMGIIAPNGHGLDEFEIALREMRSGIRFYEQLKSLNFTCQVGGIPQGVEELKRRYFSEDVISAMNTSMTYAGIAAIDCWKDAGLKVPAEGDQTVAWDTGAIIGTGIGGVDTLAEHVIPKINEGKVKRVGGTAVERTMCSGPSARLGGLFALGGQVTTNSSACTTGTEAVAMAFFQIKEGRAQRMLAGGTEGSSHYIWGCFDAMRVLSRGFNDRPESASRPMSATAAGFVPSSGAGILMLENLESALARGARIYAEILGSATNCGGQRGGGSMTAPNSEGVRRCIQGALRAAGIRPEQIDAINGHLTATMADPIEVENWRAALETTPAKLPLINSTKSLIGHALGATGGIECVASVLQLSRGFIHGSANCEDLHPRLVEYSDRIPRETRAIDAEIMAKASFGFGDVNACVIFKRWTS